MAFATASIGALQVLRTEFLWLLLPAALLIWALARHCDPQRQWRQIIAPHLLNALLIMGEQRRRWGPVHLLAAVWLLGIIALAGPAWRHEPSPFTEDQAALVIALKVTPSMQTQDVQPSRLQRAVHKIHDLLASRAGARTALIAYAGSAHLVMPLTRDAEIINSFATELQPELIPRPGDDPVLALALAEKQLMDAQQAGSVLFITDGITPAEATRMAQRRPEGPAPMVILGTVGLNVDSPERRELERTAEILSVHLEFLTPDGRDVASLTGKIERSMSSVADAEGGERWRDEGYWLVPLLCALALLWFRPGWVVTWA
jgi:Ca-activated chloride channel family protein